MQTSLFLDYVNKYFKPLVIKVSEKINEKKTKETYLFPQMTTEEYSPDLKWGSEQLNTSIVAADVVSMGSELPLKKRDTLQKASGNLPKIGIKLRKDEKDISDIQIMAARGATEAQIARKIMDDTPKCINGVEMTKEIMFEQGLSTGVTLIQDDKNTGVGIRVEYGFKPENVLNSAYPWSGADSVPMDDIDRLLSKVQEDSNAVAVMIISKKYLNLLKKTYQGKLLVANFNGQTIVPDTVLPVPSNAALLSALEDHTGCKVIVNDIVCRYEKDGVQTSFKPWEQANIAFLPAMIVARIVYGTVPEKNNPVAGVVYQTATQGTLVSKFSHNEPLEELTSAQAIALPVFDGVDQFHILKCDQTRISASPLSLSFTKTADTTGKVINVTCEAESIASAVSDQDFATVSVSGKKVTVKVSANSGTSAPERSANIKITDSDGLTITATVLQAANA